MSLIQPCSWLITAKPGQVKWIDSQPGGSTQTFPNRVLPNLVTQYVTGPVNLADSSKGNFKIKAWSSWCLIPIRSLLRTWEQVLPNPRDDAGQHEIESLVPYEPQFPHLKKISEIPYQVSGHKFGFLFRVKHLLVFFIKHFN